MKNFYVCRNCKAVEICDLDEMCNFNTYKDMIKRKFKIDD